MMVETFGSERFAFEEMFLIEKSFAALTGILLDELFDSFLAAISILYQLALRFIPLDNLYVRAREAGTIFDGFGCTT